MSYQLKSETQLNKNLTCLPCRLAASSYQFESQDRQTDLLPNHCVSLSGGSTMMALAEPQALCLQLCYVTLHRESRLQFLVLLHPPLKAVLLGRLRLLQGCSWMLTRRRKGDLRDSACVRHWYIFRALKDLQAQLIQELLILATLETLCQAASKKLPQGYVLHIISPIQGLPLVP